MVEYFFCKTGYDMFIIYLRLEHYTSIVKFKTYTQVQIVRKYIMTGEAGRGIEGVGARSSNRL